MNPEKIFAISVMVKDLQKELTQKQASYREELNKYIVDYFKGNVPKVFALSKNQFITGINERNFELQHGSSGIYWIVKGYLATVKDGSIKYGHSLKTLYQGEYEAMSQDLKSHTLEAAKQLTKPIFPIVPRVYHGVDFANIGYELARNEDLGIILIWRKAAIAYVDRSVGSLSSESELQILSLNNYSVKVEVKKNIITLEKDTQDELVKKWMTQILSKNMRISIHSGGRLNKAVILKYSKSINEIFGTRTVSNIIENIEKQGARKKFTDNNAQKEDDKKDISSEIDLSSKLEYKGLKF